MLKRLLLSVILGSSILVSLFLFRERIQPPMHGTLAPLFQQLGKPVKSADRALSQLLPVSEIDEKMLGEEIKARFAAKIDPSDIPTLNYLNDLIQTLTEESRKPFTYTVFLDHGAPNAYALPGGVICITHSLFYLLDNEAELAAILAHEVGHIERGHLFDHVREQLLARKISQISILAYASEVFHAVTRHSFCKTCEDEADDYAFRKLLSTQYDPFALSDAFSKLLAYNFNHQRQPDLLKDFFSTHPYTELRIENYRTKALQWQANHPKEFAYRGKKNLVLRKTRSNVPFEDEYLKQHHGIKGHIGS
ncbi:MAG: M48 family metallopeptidase [Parachlamydia sp.]|nr:M48 family metallopeptidase [Parachlamydia sp.]